MKILHVIHIGAMGGAEKLLIQLIPALNKMATTDCLILNRNSVHAAADEVREGLLRQGIHVYSISYDRLTDLSILSKLAGKISNGNYDLVHSHLKYADTWLAWLKFRGKIRVPVITTIHGYKDEYENINGFRIVRSIYYSPYFLLTRWIYRRLDGFILISKVVKKFVNETGLVPVSRAQQTIYHGYQPAGKSPAEKRYNDETVIALPGRLLRRKGHYHAIEAMQILVQQGKKVQLHFYGEGNEREGLTAAINTAGLQGKVVIHGYVADLPARLQSADIVIIPSLWEGFGLVFLDAFASGTPVVAFDLPAANELITDDHNGLLAKPGDSRDLAGKIALLAGDRELRRRIADTAATELRQRFSMDGMVNRYFEFYHQVTGRRPESQAKSGTPHVEV